MRLGSIPILEEWEARITRYIALTRRAGTLYYGFTPEILEASPHIQELSRELPVFRGLSRYPTLEEILRRNIHEALERLDGPENTNEEMGEIAFWDSIGLLPLHILMTDPENQEIYILGGDNEIRVRRMDGASYKTNMYIGEEGLTALRRILELIVAEGVSRRGGSIEADISTVRDRFRIVLDTFPLTHGETYAVIRRHMGSGNTLEGLVERGFMDEEQRITIQEQLRRYPSILIMGEPNSGKTTLLNAILKELPGHLRILILEEARETEDLRPHGYHHIYYRQSGIVESEKRGIQTLFNLRRSPDYVVYGEVITNNDIQHMLETLLMGIRIMATIHASDIESLIMRLGRGFGEGYEAALKQVGLVLITSRDLPTGRRYLRDIYLSEELEEGLVAWRQY